MRNTVRFACAGLVVFVVVWHSHADDNLATTQPAVAAISSQWSAPSQEGLQTRLVSITKSVRPGKPLFIQMEVRHKDGKDWAQATIVLANDYPAEVVVRDKDSKVVDSLFVRLRFRTMVPAGEKISIGVFPAGKASAFLRAGTYSVSIESKVTPELLKRGAVQLPVAGPIQFVVPSETGSDPSDSTLKADYAQAEELKIYMKAWGWGYPTQLVEQGKPIVPGLVALVEKGDNKVSDHLNLQLWQCAAVIIGDIGDKRAVPFLLKRLDDPNAMDWRLVCALGKLGVKEAVPKLVEELRTMDNRGWEVMSQAYGSKATYLVEALERITGQKFPKDEHGRPTDRDTTLKAVNEWWAKQDAKVYAMPETRPTKAASER
jgi:hypothetical protein